jgi:hypothetical protein
MFAKIISGGQTGVDRAALDVALGGWGQCKQSVNQNPSVVA